MSFCAKYFLGCLLHLLPPLWCSVVFLQITPCFLVLKLEIQKNIFLWMRQQGLISKQTERNKMYNMAFICSVLCIIIATNNF